MWPRRIPVWITTDKRRSAEIKVFEALEKCFDESWSVYYSRPWYGISPSGGEIEGEADFIIANAQFGIFFLEVKGGQISYDPTNSQWHTVDRNGIKHKIKDPIDQAKKCRYEFARKLEKIKGWPQHHINYKYGAVFTDTLEPKEEIRTIGGHEKSLFCHSAEFQSNLESWIRNRMLRINSNSALDGLGAEGMRILDEQVAQPVKLVTSIGSQVHGDVEEMDQLFTGAQFQAMLSIKTKSRVVVSGGAGTGKTLLASQLAISYAKLNSRVLFITCSKPLAIDIQRQLSEFTNIKIETFLEIQSRESFFNLWDLVVVDEAQDIDWNSWQDIEKMCVSTEGQLFVFMDSNQSIYRPSADLTTFLSAESYELNVNLRNTQQIAKATEILYAGPLIHAPGPLGVAPKIYQASKYEEAIELCSKLIVDLTVKDSLRRSDITILCRDKNTREKIRHDLNSRKIFTSSASERKFDTVCVETVPLFKGLESLIVIAMCDSEWANSLEMSYVSISRARALLYVIGNIRETIIEKASRNS